MNRRRRIFGIVLAHAAWLIPIILSAVRIASPDQTDGQEITPVSPDTIRFVWIVSAAGACGLVALIGLRIWGTRYVFWPALLGLCLSLLLIGGWYSGYIEHQAFQQSREIDRRMGL